MSELLRLIIATLSQDYTLQQLLGVRTRDPRIYHYYQGDAVISDEQRAYITLAMTANPERTWAVREPVITAAVWAIRGDIVDAVRERLLALLDFTDRPHEYLETESGRKVQPILIAEHDSAQENTKFSGEQFTFRFGESAV